MLLSYAWQDDFSFPAQETLARDLASGDRSVRRWLTELKHQGFISWKQPAAMALTRASNLRHR